MKSGSSPILGTQQIFVEWTIYGNESTTLICAFFEVFFK